MNPIRIKMLPEEQVRIHFFGEEWMENKRLKGVKDLKISPKDARRLVEIGATAEVAFFGYCGLDYPYKIFDYKDDKDICLNGKWFDIKGTVLKGLRVPEYKLKDDIDGYILVELDPYLTEATIIGCISKPRFLKHMYRYKNPDFMTVDTVHLRPVDLIIP
jgi:hypothetical protein